MNNSFSLIDLIRIILKWKWAIVMLTVLAAAGSTVVSLVLPEYYESSALILPANPAVGDRQTIFAKESGIQPVTYFGTKEDVNRLLTLANSSPIVDFIINNYKLWEHYGIDTTSSGYWRYKVKKEFEKNYKAIKTENGFISITLIDRDFKLAAEMVNMIVKAIDQHNSDMIQGSKTQILESLTGELENNRKNVTLLTDSLSKAKSAGWSSDKIMVLDEQLKSAVTSMNELATLKQQYQISADQKMSSIHVVEKAYPSEKKVKPVRWLICTASTLLAFFLGILGAILFERFKIIRAQLADDK